jgi:putative copper export protein/methionine-rich copper-binding protein CopC
VLKRKLTVMAVAAVGAVLLLNASPAGAHAELLSSEPPAGAALAALPTTVILHFSEGVDLSHSSIVAVGPDGRAFALSDLMHRGGDDATLIGTVPDTIKGAGDIAVRWRSVSKDDGHVASGEYNLGLPSSSASQSAFSRPLPSTTLVQGPVQPGMQSSLRASPIGVSDAFAAVRMLNYLSLAILCGGLGFIGLLWPAGADVDRGRRLLYGAWAAGIVTTLLGVGLQGATISQKPLPAAMSPPVIASVLTTEFGRVWVSKGLLFLLAFPVLWMLSIQGARAAESIAWKVGAAAVGVGLLRMPGLIGHTSEARHAALGSVADLAHLIGVALWLGGLVFLGAVVLPRRRPDELARLVPRFSTLAMASVGTVALAGLIMSWQLLGSVHALVASHFGHVLLVKLAVFVVLVLVASASKRWVSVRLNLAVRLNGDVVTLRPFVVSVATEVVLALGLLTVASVLVNTSPAH